MERPNRDKILKEFNDKNYVAYGSSIENEYHKRIELYVTYLEKQLLLHDVVVPKGTLCQHDRKVTNRICDDCGSVITYVPDEDLA